jgi:hypothetical protein
MSNLYKLKTMKIALGVSLSSNKLFLIERLVSAFRDRVIADGGVFEERDCLEAQLRILKNIL